MPGIQLLDPKTGKPTTFADPNAATAAYVQGQAGVKGGAPVPVVWTDGSIHTVDPADVARALGAGAQFATQEQYRDAKIDARLGPAGQVLEKTTAALTGASRAGTFGLSDKALIEGVKIFGGKQSGENMRETLQTLREKAPIATAAGEVGATLAQAFIPVPGAGAAGAVKGLAGAAEAARGAEAAVAASEAARGVMSADRALGLARLVPTVDRVGTAAEAIGRPLGSIGKAAARGAAENALFAAQHEVTESILGDNYDLTASKLFSAMGEGALVGAAIGGGLGAVGAAGKGALRLAAPKLDELSAEQAWRVLGARKAFVQQAERAGGTSAIGRTLRDEGIVAFGDSAESIAPKIAAAKQQAFEDIGRLMSEGAGTMSGQKLIGEVDGIIAKHRSAAGFEGMVRSLETYRDALAVKLGLSAEGILEKGAADVRVAIKDVFEQRKFLDDLVYRETKAMDPNMRIQAMRDIRKVLDHHITDAIDTVGKESGKPGLGQQLKAAKRRAQHLALAEEAVEDTLDRSVANRGLSLTDYGPALAAVAGGHFAAAPLAAIGHKIVRERGNAAASVALDKLAQLGGVKRAVESTDLVLDRAAANAVTPQVSRGNPVKPAAITPGDEHYQRAKARSVAYETNPAGASEQIASRAAAIGPAAPATQAAYAMRAATVAQYLASRRPPVPVPPVVPGVTVTPEASPQERRRYALEDEAARNPNAVLKRISAGVVEPTQLRTIRDVHPELADDFQARVADKLAQRVAKGTIDDPKEIARIQAIINAPITPASTPESLRMSQSIYSSDGAATKPAAAAAPRLKAGSVKLAPPPNRTDRLESGR